MIFLKISFVDNNLIVFLNSKNIEGISFNERDLEKYFHSLFFKLGDYGLDFSGSYDIDVYIDDFYGMVVVVKSNGIDYYDDIVTMNISISKYRNFLYKSDIFIDVDCDIYCYDGCFYYEPHDVSFMDIGVIIENCEIIYGSLAHEIRFCGNVIDKIY